MLFEIVGTIFGIETFAKGTGIRELPRINKVYGRGRWLKRKGIAEGKKRGQRNGVRSPIARIAASPSGAMADMPVTRRHSTN